MRFIARYISWPNDTHKPEYYRTIHADGIMEADRLGKHYERKGYMLQRCTQVEFSE